MIWFNDKEQNSSTQPNCVSSKSFHFISVNENNPRRGGSATLMPDDNKIRHWSLRVFNVGWRVTNQKRAMEATVTSPIGNGHTLIFLFSFLSEGAQLGGSHTFCAPAREYGWLSASASVCLLGGRGEEAAPVIRNGSIHGLWKQPLRTRRI